MKKYEETLLAILAKTDATFWPSRTRGVSARALSFERRRAFPTVGVPWSSGAVTEAGRKSAQRELEALLSAKLVETYNPRGGRTLGVRLTDTADDATRRMIGLATYADSLPFLDELHRRLSDGDAAVFLGRPWTSEESLTGIQWGDNERRVYYALLTEDLYPLLCRGLVEGNSSMLGHCWYGLTAVGHELARQRAEDGQASREYPPPPPEEGNAEALAFYRARRREEIGAIESATPKDTREIGRVPMPVCPVLRKWQTPRLAILEGGTK